MQGRLNAKAKYFEYLEKTGKMPAKLHEEEPEDVSFDWDEEPAEEVEPEPELESEPSMEFMSLGGRVKRHMAKGGMVHKSDFAKALQKAS